MYFQKTSQNYVFAFLVDNFEIWILPIGGLKSTEQPIRSLPTFKKVNKNMTIFLKITHL